VSRGATHSVDVLCHVSSRPSSSISNMTSFSGRKLDLTWFIFFVVRSQNSSRAITDSRLVPLRSSPSSFPASPSPPPFPPPYLSSFSPLAPRRSS